MKKLIEEMRGFGWRRMQKKEREGVVEYFVGNS